MTCDFSRVEQWWVPWLCGKWVWVTDSKLSSCHCCCWGNCSLSHITDLWFLVLNAHLNWTFLLGFPLSNPSPHAERKPGLPPWSLTHRTGPQLIWQEFWKSAPKPAARFPLATNRSLQLGCIECPEVASRGHVPTWSGLWGPEVFTLSVGADGFLEPSQTVEMGPSTGHSTCPVLVASVRSYSKFLC